MQKILVFTAYNGTEIIDPRPEAEINRENQRYFEERYDRQLVKNIKRNKHPFAKALASAMGML